MVNEMLDEAYERLSKSGPEFQGWLSNHGPMAADALIRIGCAEAVPGWIDNYKRRLEDFPTPRWRITEKDWQEYLGDPSRLGDWLELFSRQMKSEPWKDVLARWWPRLIVGSMASATHGLIRTGHAVRALGEIETPTRLTELGHALGYWAARWQKAPSHLPLGGSSDIGSALEQLFALGIDGGIRTQMRHLENDAGWAEAVGSIQVPARADAVPQALEALVNEAVQRYLRWAHGNAVMLVHCATAPRAAALALSALPIELWLLTFEHVWVTTAAIISAYRPPEEHRFELDSVHDLSDLRIAELASEHGDEHVIKFAEVAIECRQRGVLEAPLAAARAIDLIEPARG